MLNASTLAPPVAVAAMASTTLAPIAIADPNEPGSEPSNREPSFLAQITFKFLVEGIFMPAVSALGLAGNGLSIRVLRQREVKLKKDFVEILCALATFDNLMLVCTFFLFSMPALCQQYKSSVFPYTGKNETGSLVSHSTQLIHFFIRKKWSRPNAVLSAIFYVLYSAKLRKMPSSTIFVAIIYVVKLR